MIMVNALTHAHLSSMMQGNSSLVADLVDHFVVHTPLIIDRFESQLQADDWNGLYGTSLRLISSFRLMQEHRSIELLNALDEANVCAMSQSEKDQLCEKLQSVVAEYA
jgi:HPt (histidine-containing phosphotransfer) domain-containing protein